VAGHRVLIHLLARNAEAVRDDLGGLAHVEFDQRIGEAKQQGEHRLEMTEAETGDSLEALADIARAHHAG